MKIKFTQSLIFRVVIAYILLFITLFGVLLIFRERIRMVQVALLVFIFSLATIIYFLVNWTQSISKISKQLDAISEGKFDPLPQSTNSAELDALSIKIAQLGIEIEHTQNDLEDQHNQFNGILTYMTDGVIATDRAGQIVLANAAAQHLLGATNESLQNQTLASALQIETTYDFKDLLEQAPEIIIDTVSTYGEDMRVKINFSIFRKDNGYISGIVAVMHDVTEQERLDREHRLFVSNVSHELRTPLTTIKSYLETLKDGALSSPETADSFVTTSLDETNRMIHMITDLLDLSRIDLKTSKLEKEVVNIVAFLSYQISRLTQILATGDFPDVKIEPILPLHPIWMEFDTSKMGQVIDNLLNNAVKYSPDGGTISVRLDILSNYVHITISDEGIGIPTKDLSRIFDRFYRVDTARARAQGGSGLGLALVQDIIKMHEGTVFVRSELGQGTAFTVVLPYIPMTFDETDWDNDETDPDHPSENKKDSQDDT